MGPRARRHEWPDPQLAAGNSSAIDCRPPVLASNERASIIQPGSKRNHSASFRFRACACRGAMETCLCGRPVASGSPSPAVNCPSGNRLAGGRHQSLAWHWHPTTTHVAWPPTGGGLLPDRSGAGGAGFRSAVVGAAAACTHALSSRLPSSAASDSHLAASSPPCAPCGLRVRGVPSRC